MFLTTSSASKQKKENLETQLTFSLSFHRSTGALHTVLFCRLLGSVRPVDAFVSEGSFGGEELVFSTCGDAEVAAAVDEKAAAFGAWALSLRSSSPSSATVVLSLRERSAASSGSGSSPSSSSLPWETWRLSIRVSPHLEEQEQQEQQGRKDQAFLLRGEQGLRSLLLSVSCRAAARTAHIPPVLTASVVTFPFEIAFEGGGAEDFSSFSSSSSSSTQQQPQQQQQIGRQRSSSSSLNLPPRSSPSPSPSPSPSAGSVLRGGLGAVKRLLQAAPPPPVLG
jgi:hypothetical protein